MNHKKSKINDLKTFGRWIQKCNGWRGNSAN